MEIRPEEVKELEESPIEIYYKSFKSDITKKDYTQKLKKVLCQFFAPILKGDPALIKEELEIPQPNNKSKFNFPTADFEIRANEFVRRAKADPKWAETLIIKLLEKLLERTKLEPTNADFIERGSVSNYYWPVQKLLENNDVVLPWKRLKRTLPVQGNSKHEAYTKAQLQTMLQHADIDESLIVVLAAASGIRAGAFDLKWQSIIPVYEYQNHYLWETPDVTESVAKEGKLVCVLIRIYADEPEEYFALATPEFWNIAQEAKKKWIKDVRREPTPNDPVIKQEGNFVKPLSAPGIRRRLERLLVECGMRGPLPPGRRRHTIPLFNGFRYFFDKTTKKAISQNSLLGQLIIKEKMMGHGGLIPLNKNYFREIAMELIQEYLPAIPDLTINNAEQERLEKEKILKEKQQLESDKSMMKDIKKDMEEIRLQQIRNEKAAAQEKTEMLDEIKKLREQVDRSSH